MIQSDCYRDVVSQNDRKTATSARHALIHRLSSRVVSALDTATLRATFCVTAGHINWTSRGDCDAATWHLLAIKPPPHEVLYATAMFVRLSTVLLTTNRISYISFSKNPFLDHLG